MRQPDRIVRLKTVLARTGLSRSTIYRKIAEGTFPPQIKISTNGAGWKDRGKFGATYPDDPAGAYYRGTFEAAMQSNPDWLHISTFNELAEFSHIEATFEHGYTYIDLTAEFVKKFKGPWELYNIDSDWSQANDLAASNPQKLEEMKALFIVESTKNKNLPIGGGLWSTAMFHPEDAPASALTEWTFDFPITRMPESAAPKLGKNSSLVTMDVDVPANANGVLYALAGFSGGITTYMKDGFLNYEFNLFEVQRTKIKSKTQLPVGKVKVEVESKLAGPIGGPMDITLRANGEVVGQGRVPAAMSLHFTSNATFDIGTDLDSPVSLDYYDQAPFAFNGSIGTTKITYLKK